MAFFKHTQPVGTTSGDDTPKPTLPAGPETKDGLRDFWQHWDYLMGLVNELDEFGVDVLDAVGLTLNEAILAEVDLGTDIKAGDVLIEKGTKVRPQMVGLLTGMGIRRVMARPNPRVLVIALSEAAMPASFMVAAEVQAAGAQTHRMEFVFSSATQVVTSIIEQLVRSDLVVTVGGLGEAGLDLRAVADQIGPSSFTPVAINPGSDHGFALAEERTPLLALPAEVYPAFVLTKLLVEPMISKLMGAGTDPILFSAHLAQPLRVAPGRLTCVPATVTDARMTITGRPTGLEGLNTIYRANALAILSSPTGLLDRGSEAFYLPLG